MKKRHPSRVAYVLIFYSLLTMASSAGIFPAFATPTMEDAFSPAQGATALVIKTIVTARQSIHVAAYSFTSRPIADALVAAQGKGVDVKVVLDKSQRKGRNTLLPFLLAHHIPTRVNSHYSIMHDKFILIDDMTLELGSFNYTAAAEKKNAENVLVIHGSKKIVRDYNEQWWILWNGAEEK